MYRLADVIAATAAAKYATPAQVDYALANGAAAAEMRTMLASGATHLAELETTADHPEGLILVILDRREDILDAAMLGVDVRLLEASVLDYRVLDEGDDDTPPTVVYATTGSTGADWADALL